VSWFNRRDGIKMTDDEVRDSLLASARARDRESRLWDREHSPVDSDGSWSQEAWRNNAHLMRECDADNAEGYALAGHDGEQVLTGWRAIFWWWGREYD
jgi:hypothetical protein